MSFSAKLLLLVNTSAFFPSTIRTSAFVRSFSSASIMNWKCFSLGTVLTSMSSSPWRLSEIHASTSSGFPTVAESPILWTGLFVIWSILLSSTLRCTPRSDSTNEWSSSTIMVLTRRRSDDNFFSMRRTSSDSGVIIRK